MTYSNTVPASTPLVRKLHSRCGKILAAVAAALCLSLVAIPAAVASVFTIYMHPDGSDTYDGATPQAAIKTLKRAEEILAANDPNSDVEIRIAQGIYVAPTTVWRYYIPGHSISFIPQDYDPGDGINDIAGRPIFRSDGTIGYWFSARLPKNHPGGDTNLEFRYLQVEKYSAGGIQLYGGVETVNGITVPATAGVNNNTIFGMKFYKLGSKHNCTAGAAGRGAINTWNSSNNLIQYNHFIRNENQSFEVALIHGIYLAHHSNGNEIVSNRFDTISGDPIRTRNDSNNNDIHDNTFVLSGNAAYYSEWFCDQDCVDSHPGHGRECASHGNTFFDNYLESGYKGNAQSMWDLAPGGLNYPGGPGCDNENQPRLDTGGNTRPN